MSEMDSTSKKPVGRIRVLIADDHPVIQKHLSRFLSNQEDIELVAQAMNGKEAYELTRQLSPDILILDLEMPEMSGFEVASRLISRGCKTAILIFSTDVDQATVRTIAIEGVHGWLAKDEGLEKLLQAIRSLFELQRQRFHPLETNPPSETESL